MNEIKTDGKNHKLNKDVLAPSQMREPAALGGDSLAPIGFEDKNFLLRMENGDLSIYYKNKLVGKLACRINFYPATSWPYYGAYIVDFDTNSRTATFLADNDLCVLDWGRFLDAHPDELRRGY